MLEIVLGTLRLYLERRDSFFYTVTMFLLFAFGQLQFDLYLMYTSPN